MTEDLAELAAQANQGAHRELARRSGGRVVDEDRLCLVHGTHPSWVIANVSFRTDPSLAPAAVLERVTASFGRLGRRPVLMTFAGPDADLDTALADAGWRHVLELPVMVRRAPIDSGHPPADSRWLDPGVPADLEAMRDVLRRGMAEDDEEREVMDSLLATADAIRPPGMRAVVASVDDAPAACAAVYRIGDAAVVGLVATVPEARRRGLGRLVTGAVTNRGFEEGAAWVTLQASPMGEPLYRSMGFETVTSSRIWLAPTTPAG
jgi:GNAT superfamily N-acetyltransferase